MSDHSRAFLECALVRLQRPAPLGNAQAHSVMVTVSIAASAAENGRRLEMDLKLRGAGDSTRSSGSGYCIVIHEISD